MEKKILDTEKLKKLIAEKEITQKELAERTGVTECAMSRYINGQRTPKLFIFAKMVQVLGVEFNDLLTER